MYRYLLNAPLVTACYAVLLVTATHWPRVPKMGSSVLSSDKAIHFNAYLILAALLVCSLWRRVGSPVKTVLLAWVLAILMGMLDEITQPLTGRQCDFHDWVADATGAAVGVAGMATLLMVAGFRKRSKQPPSLKIVNP